MNRNFENLFDLKWYAKEAMKDFNSVFEAVQHYLTEGELQGCFPNPLFDPGYYRKQYNIKNDVNAFEDFCELGIELNRNPNAFFMSDWYKWQNPGSEVYAHPVFHYLSVGGVGFSDPAPFVDMEMVRRTANRVGDGVMLMNMIIKGDYHSKVGITTSYERLVSSQRKFLDKHGFNVHKQKPVKERRKYLLWVQCSLGTEFFDWYKDEAREWDLLLNFYDTGAGRSDLGDFVISQRGTKFTAIFNIWRHTDILDTYDYMLFIDDDLIFKYKDIDKYFSIISKECIDMSQPSLSKGSFCTWPVFYRAGFRGIRKVNGVEIMMPAFSRRCFDLIAPYFGISVSGFGLDLLFAKLVGDCGYKIAVVDTIKVSHNSEINQSAGAYYEMIRANGINSKYELWSLVTRFGLEAEFYEV